MVWPFERGKLYSRRIDIHARYGGQQQGGIITPAKHPLVVIVTGENGQQHGYVDRLREDGVFEYFGMGQVGPMQMSSGNLAIATHSMEGESLLLFTKVADGRLRFEGEWVCENVQQRQAPDRNGDMRLAFVFELRPLENLEDVVADEPEAGDLDELRRRAIAAARIPAGPVPGVRNVYQRSKDVRAYVLARAGVRCEGCEAEAPFNRPDGSPYLEPHHLRRLSDGGPDDPRFVIGLCPTCHRRTHYAGDAQAYNTTLIAKMQVIEPPALR